MSKNKILYPSEIKSMAGPLTSCAVMLFGVATSIVVSLFVSMKIFNYVDPSDFFEKAITVVLCVLAFIICFKLTALTIAFCIFVVIAAVSFIICCILK